MSNYSIAISGLDAAQKAFDVIGNNIANAATEGYHLQRINLTPSYSSPMGPMLLGGGVDVESVTRAIDSLLEQEILRQQSLLEQVSQESTTLQTIESALGEFSLEDTGLNAAIDKFFSALQDLSTNPHGVVLQNQLVSDAEAMASQFRTLGEFLTTLETQVRLEAENTIESINMLTSQIAELNDNIERLEVGGGQANNLRDQRDKCISDLSKLIGVQTNSREYGVVDVNTAGIPMVMGASTTALEVGLDANNNLAISIVGTYNYTTNIQGGKIGGLLSLKNDLISNVHNNLDSLAKTIIQQINQHHVQGVGSEGSFTDLTGWQMASENLADLDTVTDGTIYIRVTNTSTGEVTRHQIDVDVSADSLTTLATDISNITGLTASVTSSSQLNIQAGTNYKFDFLPAVLSEPTENNLTGTPPTITVSGIYTGTTNDTFTFTVVGSGSVGNDTLQLAVTDGDGGTVATLNVGSGYAAGDPLDLGNGIKISLSTGDLIADETFKVDAFADTDTSGVLSAIGINTFFFGSNASNMAVCSDVSDTPGRFATSLGADMTDNANVLKMLALKDQTISDLNDMTAGEFYRRMVADVGQQLSIKQMRQDNIEVMVQNFTNQQNEISGVDINEQAAQLLIFEQMFQAMAKYLTSIQASIDSLIQII